MADAKISQLPETIAPLGVDVIPIVTGGDTKKVTLNNVLALGYQGADVRALTGKYEALYTQVESTSSNWDKSYNISLAYSAVSSTFLTSETDSQTLSFNESTKDLTISNGNTVSLSALVDLVAAVDTGVRALTGDWQNTYTNVQTNSAQWASNIDTEVRDLTANWQNTYIDVGLNSALWASNVDTEVRSLTGNWEDTYTTFKNVSSTFLTSETDSQTLSFNESTKDLTISNGNTISLSALTDLTSVDTGVRSLTSNWQDTFTNVRSNSALWASNVDTGVRALTGNWQDTFTNVQANSALWASNVDTGVRALTSNWESTYTNVQANSALWASNIDTGVRTLSSNWQDTFTNVQANSALWASNIDTGVRTLSSNWQDTFTNVQSNSGDWDSASTFILGIASDIVLTSDARLTDARTPVNHKSSHSIGGSDFLSASDIGALDVTVYQQVSGNWQDTYTNYSTNSSLYLTTALANASYFPLSGGIITGPTQFNNNVTIFGNLTSTGTQTFANTVFTTTSALSVVHYGEDNALWVGNNGSGDIASFYDIDQNIEILHVGGQNSTFPNVGIKVSNPNKDFTVNGEISSNNVIWDANGNSLLWNKAHDIGTAYSLASSTFLTSETDNQTLSFNELDKKLSISNGNTISLSALTDLTSVDTGVRSLSSNWQDTFTNVQSNSAQWASNVDTGVRALTANWEDTYTTFKNVSSTFLTSETDSQTLSFDEGTLDLGISNGNTLNLSSINTTFALNSSKYEEIYSNVISNSAAYLSAVDLSFLSVSGNWNQAYDISTAYSLASSTFLTSETDSQTLLFDESTLDLSISNGNTLNLSSVNTTFALNSSKYEEIYSNVISNSSAYLSAVDLSFLSVSGNWNQAYDISTAYSLASSTFLTSETDSQTLSFDEGTLDISISNGNTLNLSSINTTFASNSSKYEEIYTNVVTNSSAYLSAVDLSFLSVSGNWNQAYDISTAYSLASSTFLTSETDSQIISFDDNTLDLSISNGNTISLSALRDLTSVDTGVRSLTSNWDNAYTNLVTNSAAYLSAVDLSFLSVSGNWNQAYDISTAYSSVSSTFLTSETDSQTLSFDEGTLDVSISNGNTISLSALRDLTSVDTGVRALTGLWQTGYEHGTVYSSNSASYATNTTVDTVSTLLVLNTNFNNYKTDVANTTATLLPTTIYQNASGDWNDVYTTFKNASSTFLTSETDSQTLSFNESTLDISISNGNNVSLSALKDLTSVDTGVRELTSNWNNAYTNVVANSSSYATITFTDSKYFPLSGGVITGPTQFNGDVTIFGNLTSSGTQTFANTVFTTTSALSVVHLGSGPALWVGNDGSGDIASFYDIDQNIEILHVGGQNSLSPNVGVKISNPNKDFTVNGEISSNNIIWDANGNSQQWNQARDVSTAYSLISSTFLTSETDSQILSFNEGTSDLSISNGNTVSLSAFKTGVDTEVRALTSNWEGVYLTVKSLSSSWEESSEILPTVTNYLSGQNVLISSLTIINNLSAGGNLYGDGSNLTGIVAGDTEATTLVRTNSGNWDKAYNIGTAYSLVSSTFLTSETDSQTLSFNELNKQLSISNGNTVSLSALTDLTSVDTEVRALTGNWQTAYNQGTVYSSNSSSYVTNTTLNTISSQLVLTSDFNNYKTSVAGITSTFLPTTTYQSASGNWQNTHTSYTTNSASFIKTTTTPTPGLSAITTIIAVSAIPASPNPNILYIVI